MNALPASPTEVAATCVASPLMELSNKSDGASELSLDLAALEIKDDTNAADDDGLSPHDSVSVRGFSPSSTDQEAATGNQSGGVLDRIRAVVSEALDREGSSTSSRSSSGDDSQPRYPEPYQWMKPIDDPDREDSKPSNEAVVDSRDDSGSESFSGRAATEAEKYRALADWHAANLRTIRQLNQWHAEEMERLDQLARERSKQVGLNSKSFRNRYFEIKSSPVSGLGVFALQDIRAETTILIERVVLNTNEATIFSDLEQLRPELIEAYYHLHAHFQRPNLDRATAILYTNGFTTSRRHVGIFLVASRFNHSCRPLNNVSFRLDSENDCIVMETLVDVSAGTELTISYGAQPRNLLLKWGFRCACGGCHPLTDAEYDEIVNSTANWYEPV